jgi:hypothetical protein
MEDASPAAQLPPVSGGAAIVEAIDPVELGSQSSSEAKTEQAPAVSTQVPSSAKHQKTPQQTAPAIATEPAAESSLGAMPAAFSSQVTSKAGVLSSEMSLSELASAIIGKLENAMENTEDVELRRELSVRKKLVTLMLEDLTSDESSGENLAQTLEPASENSIYNTLKAIYEAEGAQDDPGKSLTEELKNQQDAIRDLANHSNLKVLSLAFCTAVDGFGMITKFPTYTFRADQKALLYCELEDFVSIRISDGYETKLRGYYEIVNADGKIIERYAVPEDVDTCSNRRSDFYIAYLMQMPQDIPPGDYQLRLVIEDVHGEKTGRSKIDFRIKP